MACSKVYLAVVVMTCAIILQLVPDSMQIPSSLTRESRQTKPMFWNDRVPNIFGQGKPLLPAMPTEGNTQAFPNNQPQQNDQNSNQEQPNQQQQLNQQNSNPQELNQQNSNQQQPDEQQQLDQQNSNLPQPNLQNSNEQQSDEQQQLDQQNSNLPELNQHNSDQQQPDQQNSNQQQADQQQQPDQQNSNLLQLNQQNSDQEQQDQQDFFQLPPPNLQIVTITTQEPMVTTSSTCMKKCPSTSEFHPVCGTNNQTYTNIGRLECANYCGEFIQMKRYGSC